VERRRERQQLNENSKTRTGFAALFISSETNPVPQAVFSAAGSLLGAFPVSLAPVGYKQICERLLAAIRKVFKLELAKIQTKKSGIIS
jgi:hypothetical protein